MGYTQKAKMKIYRTDHIVDFYEGKVTARELMTFLGHVPKDAVLQTVWVGDKNESHVNMEFTEDREEIYDEDN